MTEEELIWEIQHLRNGREALSDLAAHLRRAPLFDVPGRAGPDTWRGPAPEAFRETVTSQCDRLHEMIDELVTNAAYVGDRIWGLEQDLGDLRAAREAAGIVAGPH